MALPECESNGWLPPGIYDSTLEEVEKVFGRFQRTDRRYELMRKFREYIKELRVLGTVIEMIVNGSFISKEDEPGDIDVVVRLDKSAITNEDPSPYETLLLTNSMAKRRWSVDVYPALNDFQYEKMKTKFSHARGGIPKGVVRLRFAP